MAGATAAEAFREKGRRGILIFAPYILLLGLTWTVGAELDSTRHVDASLSSCLFNLMPVDAGAQQHLIVALFVDLTCSIIG